MSRNALPPARRASESALESLIGPGTPGTSVNSDASDTWVTLGTPGTEGTRASPELTAPVRVGTSDNSGIQDTPGTSDARGTAGTSITSGTSARPDPREHVKIRRGLADEMRDAVWFLSEHGRPRVRLGELLDEAVAAWLDEVKQKHNGGEDFPRRGRLR
jgi:hypothetical protein